ncbi:S-adenosylmethionine decarboxylase, partial [Clavulina sp. PMI_390]
TTTGPFEGPEKLLEIWFAPTAPPAAESEARDPSGAQPRTGLRTVPRQVWEDMLDIVKCKVLSVVVGREMDAYLLSESSFFVFPHKLILKTCGTTLNLLGLPRILAIARSHCDFHSVWRCFYSRKSFMFPERQIGPHREWRNEVEYLDALFDNGAAYTVGKMNGDHWLLYMTAPPDEEESGQLREEPKAEIAPLPAASEVSELASSTAAVRFPANFAGQDSTLEILMTKLGAGGRRPFLFLEEDLAPQQESTSSFTPTPPAEGVDPEVDAACKTKGAFVSQQLGIDTIFPRSRTTLDAYGFEPCGYSANALVNAGSEGTGEEGYYTIHVTPEEGWSYASFECNVPVYPRASSARAREDAMPDLETLIQRVVNIFQPGHLTLTLFVSSGAEGDTSSNSSASPHSSGAITLANDNDEPTSVEIAQRAFRHALLPRGYRRTDKINYEFGDYDLAFATF